MRVISRKRLLEAARAHADLSAPLDAWYRVVKQANWKKLEDVRRTYPRTDAVEQYTVFNIKGNDYRLIAKIEYRLGLIFVKKVLTHAEYDKGTWK